MDWGYGEVVVRRRSCRRVLASACTAVLGKAIKRRMRGDRGYQDISSSANAC